MPPDPPDRSPRSGEVYVEFAVVGASVKVTAIDAATGAEASAIGPASAARADLEALALAKLRRKIDPPDGAGAAKRNAPPKGRGVVV